MKTKLEIATFSLKEHGYEVFGSIRQFNEWLNTPNLFFDNKPPNEFLDTIENIQLIDDRLTGIEYGDNA